MAKAKLYSSDGSFKSEVELPEEQFGHTVDEGLLHLAVTIYRGNQRQGTAKTKGRSEVSGSGAKPWKQKGTGRARAGTNQSPIWVRGGKAHGATPRDYTRKLNKKVKKQALYSALSMKANQEEVFVIEALSLAAPKTRDLVGIMKKAELTGKKNLILTTELEANLGLASRNIPNLQISRVQELNPYEIINTNNLIFTQAALDTFTQTEAKA